MEVRLFISCFFTICWPHCCKMTLHVKPTGGWYTWPQAVLLILYLQSRFSSLAAEQKCIFFFFLLLLPCLYLSGILLGILCSELVSVYFWYTAHHGIAVFLTASSIPLSTEQNRECYKREDESLKELAMNRGNKTHWWMESKVQNERKAFGYHGACGTSHLLIPKAAAAVGRCLLGLSDPLCHWASAGIEFTLPISI